jgi:tRNA modification GTPase
MCRIGQPSLLRQTCGRYQEKSADTWLMGTGDGLSVVILGPPNAGKSSLLNALARRDVAIVSEVAGTTRDVLEVRLNLQGYPVVLADTAGLRETQEVVEVEGIRRALARASSARLRLLVVDPASQDMVFSLKEHLSPSDLVLWSKADLGGSVPSIGQEAMKVSVKTGYGLDALIDWLGARAAAETSSENGIPLTRERHRKALESAKSALDQGLDVLAYSLDLAAEDFRIASRAIGGITGRVDVEDMLDVVFREFCIGK